MKKIKAKTR